MMESLDSVIPPSIEWFWRNVNQIPDEVFQQVVATLIIARLSGLRLLIVKLFQVRKRRQVKSEVPLTEVSEPDITSLLTILRQSETEVDSLRKAVSWCECNSAKSCSVHCNHLYKLNQLKAIGDRLTLVFGQLPLSDHKVLQHIEEVWTCMNTLTLAVAKYGEGIDKTEVLPICYKLEKNDAFQQRFKDSIIGLENCLA